MGVHLRPRHVGADLRSDRSTPTLQILQTEDDHAAVVAEFFRLVWDPSATTEKVVRARAEGAVQNVAEPGVTPPSWIALRDGRVLAYVSSIPIQLWDGHGEWPTYLIKGLMVLPEFRNGPLGYLVLKAAAERLPRSASLAVAPAARRLFEALGYHDLGPIPNGILPLAPHRVLRRLDLEALGMTGLPRWFAPTLRIGRALGLATVGGWVGGVAMRVALAAARLPGLTRESRISAPAPSASELDTLWRVARHAFQTAVVRDAAYLLARYGEGTDGPYSWVTVRRRGSLAGVAIIRHPRDAGDARLRGIRVAVLADLLHCPGDRATGLALLGAAERTARRLGADAILASCSAAALRSLLRRQCYLPLPGNVHCLFRDVSGEPVVFARALEGWWLTRGDGFADEVF